MATQVLCDIWKNQYLYVAYPCMALRLSLYFIICFDSSYISVCSVNKRNNILTVSCYEMNSWACLGRIVQSLMRFGSWSGPTQSPNMDVLGVAGLIPSDNITAQTPHTNQVHDDSKWRHCGLWDAICNMQLCSRYWRCDSTSATSLSMPYSTARILCPLSK